jgi:hypothetical protein
MPSSGHARRKKKADESDESLAGFFEHVLDVTHGDKTLLDAYVEGYRAGSAGRHNLGEEELKNLVSKAEASRARTSTEARLEAVRELSRLNLPVGEPADLERESVPRPDDLLP